jgi:hypothetical protein
MNNSPEYYIEQLDEIQKDINELPDPNTKEYNDLVNQYYQQLSTMNTELIDIIDNIETPTEKSQTNVKIYDEYKDLYLTSYFTNISLLLGICLIIRYILYYIYI